MKMKIFFPAILFALATFSVETNAQELPKPSPLGKVEQKVALTNISIEYSRPSVRGREIFGKLIPYGEVWRTGANKATKLTVDTDMMIGGTAVEEGSYSLFTVPGKKEWKVILNEETELWGTGDYNPDHNVAEFTIKPEKSDKTETMLFYFDQINNGEANLIFEWAEIQLTIPVEVEYMERSIENIQTELDKLDSKFRIYNNAASFYLENDMDSEKALEYAEKSVENEAHFWNVRTLSEAHAANGDYKAAIETARHSMKLAEEADYDVYIQINKENIKKWEKEIK